MVRRMIESPRSRCHLIEAIYQNNCDLLGLTASKQSNVYEFRHARDAYSFFQPNRITHTRTLRAVAENILALAENILNTNNVSSKSDVIVAKCVQSRFLVNKKKSHFV